MRHYSCMSKKLFYDTNPSYMIMNYAWRLLGSISYSFWPFDPIPIQLLCMYTRHKPWNRLYRPYNIFYKPSNHTSARNCMWVYVFTVYTLFACESAKNLGPENVLQYCLYLPVSASWTDIAHGISWCALIVSTVLAIYHEIFAIFFFWIFRSNFSRIS